MPAKAAKAAAAAAASSMSIADQQKLSPKEAALFKQVLKFYETKQYKKAMKAVEQILAKYPQNGETIAMKGLISHGLKKKDEATALIKKGVQLNIKSHVCWHVYGLLYRAEHKYPDAIKCYLQALRYDPQNQQIMRDLSNLQVQRRMYEGFTETRRKILLAKANLRPNWIAYAIGAHLSGNHTLALSILDSFNKTQETENQKMKEIAPVNPETVYEESELKIYRNEILIESGQLDKALSYLDEIKNDVVDKYYWLETHASLLIKAGKLNEAEKDFRVLLERNPDNYRYYEGLRTTLGLAGTGAAGDLQHDEKQTAQVVALYEELRKQFPKATAPVRLPLNSLRGDSPAFRAAIDVYLRERLRKGLPALFRDLKPLFASARKAAVIQELVTGYLANLRKDLRFLATDKPKAEAPGVLLWTLYFAAHFYDHSGDTKMALDLVNEGIEHTPTFIDNYMLKARIYRHAGDNVTAYFWMEAARRLDTQDRYLNTKCVRFALRADQLEEAQKTVSLFLRDANQAERTGIEALNLQALYDMQVSWYELGAAECHLRRGEVAKALKKLSCVDKHFEDWVEDQFDYHTYALRKMTLRAYIAMIRWIDALRSHRFYFRAAKLTIQTYLSLYDNKLKADADAKAKSAAGSAAGGADGEGGDDDSKLTAAEKKAAKLKKAQAAAKEKRKAEEIASAKAAEEEAKKKADANKPKAAKLAEGKEEDPDPEGEGLAKAEPLSASVRFLKNLQLHLPNDIDTHLLAYQLYTRKAKPLLVLQALKRGVAIDATHPDVHVAVCTFFAGIDGAAKAKSQVASDAKSTADADCVAQVIAVERKETPAFALTHDLAKFNADYVAKHRATSALHRLAAARVMLLLNASAKADAVALASVMDATSTIESCEAVVDWLKTLGGGAETAFKAAALKRFPYTPAFGAVLPTLPSYPSVVAAAATAAAGTDSKERV